MGSVKDLEIKTDPNKNELGIGTFNFSDRFSIFDWGVMPDHIQNKGAALCMMAAWNFERLEDQGIPTHYLGVLDSSEKLVKTSNLLEPSTRMVITLSKVIKPNFENGKYSYIIFTENRGGINNYVIPLEFIYRRGAPEGSSLFKKIAGLEEKGDLEGLKKLLAPYGLTEKPKPGDLFPKTGYDFTTKFESSDRILTEREAYENSGLTEEYLEKLKSIRDDVVKFVSGRAQEVNLINFDGKLEFRFFNGVQLADVVGTFDENRFMFNGEQVSKEVLRQHYKKAQPGWCGEVERAKQEAAKNGISDWKSLVIIQPQKLDPDLISLVGEMYAAGSDLYTGSNLFRVRPLEIIMEELRTYQ